ncbi:MAG: EAL domain-containing protein [Limnothrix sp. RL_2_0]|nr:EAL domain-containing protein [Limnothrix sp. RL_2_0]
MNNCQSAESQLKIQNELLAKIAKGEPPAQIFTALVEALETSFDQALCSLLLIDHDSRFYNVTAPSLPDGYKQAVNQALITANAGPCAEAVLRRETVIISDIAQSSLEQHFKDLAVIYGFQACWSTPIFGSDGGVLGIFATYYQTRRSPQIDELETVAQMSPLICIAIERQQAKEQLRHSEMIFLETQQVAHVGSWSFELISQTITWSPEMFRLYGLEPTAATPTYEEYLQMLLPGDRQRLQQYIEQAITEGKPYIIDYSLPRPDGTLGYHECRAEVKRNTQGQITQLFGTSLDITERKQAELALQNLVAGTAATGEDFFPALVQYIAEALHVSCAIVTEKTDDDLTTLAFWVDGCLMPTYKYFLAHTPCEYVFQTGEFYCNQNIQQQFPNDLDLVELQAESYLGIALVNAQDEAIGHLYILHKQPIANPSWAKQILRVFAARAAAELERQQAESIIKQQSAAMEAAIDGISILKDGNYIYVNQAYLNLFGYGHPAELIAKPWTILHSPTEVQRVRENVFPELDQDRAWHGEAIATRKDGSTFIEEVSLTMTEENLLIQVCRDISDRKQAEIALQNLILGTAASTGEDFFPALTRHIAEALQVSYAIVSEYIDGQLHTLAFWANGEVQPNLVYNPVQTPCEITLQTGRFYCAHSVQQCFPDDFDLVQMNAESYLGIALKDSEGNSIGDLCILNQEKISIPHRAEQILQVFAARAGAEVERLRAGVASKRQLAAIEAAIDGISILQGSSYLYVNQAYLDLFGYETAEELVGQSWQQLYSSGEMSHLEQDILPKLTLERAWQGEAIATRKDGSTFTQGLSLTLTEDDLLISVCRDISDLKQAQAQISHNALHDPLTNLPNRILILERLEQAMNRAKRRQNYQYAVLFIDLDRFKVINDSLGHLVGDQLLMAIAQRLQHNLRKTDLVARLGGDEFLILLEDCPCTEEVVHITERILEDCKTPLAINGHQIFTGMSIGIVLGNKDYKQAGDLIRDADIAMYRAKTQGSNSYKFFDTAMHTQALKRLSLEADLRKAIAGEEFKVYYQPIIDLSNHHLVGFEALVRWQHPDQGLISPHEFIPIAEEIGFIVALDRWVFEQACLQMKYWHNQSSHYVPLKISINLSAKDLHKPALIQDIDSILQSTKLPGCAITLEITESMLIDDINQTISILNQLAERQIHISIDDFGTGYSSLNYLNRLPVHNLKIDQSFVSQIQLESRNHKVINTIVTLSKQIGLTTVAEGIETHQQLDYLQQLGCQFGQGYLFSKPLPAEEIEARFFQTNALPTWKIAS